MAQQQQQQQQQQQRSSIISISYETVLKRAGFKGSKGNGKRARSSCRPATAGAIDVAGDAYDTAGE